MNFNRIALVVRRVSITAFVLLCFLMFPLLTLGCISFYIFVPITPDMKANAMRILTYAALAACAVLAGFVFGAPGFFGVLAVPAAAIFWSILAGIGGAILGILHAVYEKFRKPTA